MLARRNFRPAARHSEPVAHVLWTLHCDRLFLPGSAASFPGLPARLHIPDPTSTSTATPTDLLVLPCPFQQGLQEPVVAQPAANCGRGFRIGNVAGRRRPSTALYSDQTLIQKHRDSTIESCPVPSRWGP